MDRNYKICGYCKSILPSDLIHFPGKCPICKNIFSSEKFLKEKSELDLKESEKKRLEKSLRKLDRIENKELKEKKKLARIKKKQERIELKKERVEKKKKSEYLNQIRVKAKQYPNTYKDTPIFENLPDELKIDESFNERYIVIANDLEKPKSGNIGIFKSFDKKNNCVQYIDGLSGGFRLVEVERIRKFIKGVDRLDKDVHYLEAILSKYGSVARALLYVSSSKSKK